jgi:hypothetical protein
MVGTDLPVPIHDCIAFPNCLPQNPRISLKIVSRAAQTRLPNSGPFALQSTAIFPSPQDVVPHLLRVRPRTRAPRVQRHKSKTVRSSTTPKPGRSAGYDFLWLLGATLAANRGWTTNHGADLASDLPSLQNPDDATSPGPRQVVFPYGDCGSGESQTAMLTGHIDESGNSKLFTLSCLVGDGSM